MVIRSDTTIGLTNVTRRKILEQVNALLCERDVVVEFSRGVRFVNNYDTGCREAEPTDGYTLTITVNGGAREERETVEDEFERLILSLRRTP